MKFFENRNELIKSLPKGLKIAELGVFKGEFSKELYEICQPSELHLVDLFGGVFGSGDKDGNNYHFADLTLEMQKIQEHFFGHENVKVIKASTIDYLNSLEDDHLDMVYVDADHSYNSVKTDLNLSRRKVKKDGFICGHDYVENTEAYYAIKEFCTFYKLEIQYLSKDGCPSFCIINKK
jgi:hypothetical protein